MTIDELKETDAWNVRLDGSILLGEQGADTGQPHGFDQLLTHAFVASEWWVPADWPAVVAHFRDELETRGWRGHPRSPGPELAQSWRFDRGDIVALLSRMSGASSEWRPRVEVPDGGTSYRLYIRPSNGDRSGAIG